MQKSLIFIALTLLLVAVSSCATSKRKAKSDAIIAGKNVSAEFVMQEAIKNNLIEEGVIIDMGRINLSTDDFRGSFTFEGKANNEGDFMIRIYGPLGIEVFRIYSVANETYFINRIERTVYKGRIDKLKTGFGISDRLFEIIIGDIPKGFIMAGENTLDMENNSVIAGSNDGKREAIIDRKELKMTEQTISSNENDTKINISYRDFRNIDDKIYPSIVEIRETSGDFSSVIQIEEFHLGCKDEIKVKLPEYKVVEL